MRCARSGNTGAISPAAVKKTIMTSAGSGPVSRLALGTAFQPSGRLTSTIRSPGLSPSLRASTSGSMRQEHVMFADTTAFSGFAVGDLAQAQEFYGQTLGLRTS